MFNFRRDENAGYQWFFGWLIIGFLIWLAFIMGKESVISNASVIIQVVFVALLVIVAGLVSRLGYHLRKDEIDQCIKDANEQIDKFNRQRRLH